MLCIYSMRRIAIHMFSIFLYFSFLYLLLALIITIQYLDDVTLAKQKKIEICTTALAWYVIFHCSTTMEKKVCLQDQCPTC